MKVYFFPSTVYLDSYFGSDSWAVIIGDCEPLDFSNFIATHHRLNICVISKDAHKYCEMVRDRNPGIKTRNVDVQFSQISTIKEYKKMVMFNLTDIDIAMVVFMQSQNGQEMVRVNTLRLVYLTKTLLPHLAKRSERSGILIISPGPKTQFSAFSSKFAQILSEELNDKIDITSFEGDDPVTALRYLG